MSEFKKWFVARGRAALAVGLAWGVGSGVAWAQTALSILQHPTSRTVCQGESTTFSVSVVGSLPLYQWEREGLPLAGATNATLSLTNIQGAQAGKYRVKVQNLLGSVTSSEAVLTVLLPPVITLQPLDTVVKAGQSGEIKVEVTGTQPFSFQWYRGGTRLTGATDYKYSWGSYGNPEGGYSVVISNSAGMVTSRVATVTVITQVSLPLLPFSDYFASRGTLSGATGVGSANAAGATVEYGEPYHAGVECVESMWVRWVAPSNGVMQLDTIGSTYDTVLAVYRGTSFGTLTRVVSDDESGGFHTSRVLFNVQKGVEYQFVVDSYAKKLGGLFTFSWHFVPSLCPLPENILPPVSQALKPGGNLELCATWTHPGNCALGLQWHLDGEPVPGATNACLVLSNVSAEAVGQYTLRVASADWTYWTVPAEVQLNTEGSSALARNRLEDARGSALVGVIEEGFKAGKSMKSGAPLASGYSGSQVFKTYPGKDPAEPDACGVAGGASYWFEYTPPEEGTLFLNTDGSTFDTVLAIYTDNGLNLGYASLVELACDNNSGTNGRTSALQVPVKRGTNYFIMVDGVNGASGRVSLNYRLDTPPKLSTIPTQSVKQNEATGWIPFTVGDSDLASVVFTGSSPVPDWVDAACFEFGGSGSNRTVRVTPRPERFGTNHVKITATDRIGGTRSTEFTLRVARQVSPLVVGSRLPAAGQGEAYRAVVPASGGVPPYSFTLLAGPAGFTLAADGVLTGQGSAGSYELQVRVADSEGRTTNAVVALAVVPPVRLHPTRSGDGLVFAFTGKPEKGYVLETTGDLAAGIWTALATNRAADGVISFSAVPPTGAAGFFRVREVP